MYKIPQDTMSLLNGFEILAELKIVECSLNYRLSTCISLCVGLSEPKSKVARIWVY